MFYARKRLNELRCVPDGGLIKFVKLTRTNTRPGTVPLYRASLATGIEGAAAVAAAATTTTAGFLYIEPRAQTKIVIPFHPATVKARFKRHSWFLLHHIPAKIVTG